MRYIAFLRGVNVGGRKVPMADLRECLEKAGCTGVRTVLQSGNVALEAPPGLPAGADDGVAALRALLEREISARFGYDALVQVLTADAVLASADAYPFPLDPVDPPVHPYLVLVDDVLVTASLLAAGPGLDAAVEAIAPAPTGVYWRVLRGSTLESRFGKLLGTAAVKTHVTTRNLATVRKVLA